VKSFVPGYYLQAARDLGEALSLLSRERGDWQLFAGGTDLMVLLEAGKLAHRKFLSVWNLRELRGIDVAPEYVTLGALTTYTQIREHALLGEEFPLLARAAAETGSLATQNRGTLGGNIANASPAADSPPALLVYDAQLELASAAGSRWIAYRDFHTGYKQMNLRSDELIRSVRLPRMWAGWQQYYRKVGTRRAQAISKVCFAGTAKVDGRRIQDVRIALASVAPTVVRATGAERLLRGQELDAGVVKAAREALERDIVPIDDIRSTSKYRLLVAKNLLSEFLELCSS
jgi:CO/xanthine dehydrogenase FAD-binding subunit